jgi:hypothetical protein
MLLEPRSARLGRWLLVAVVTAIVAGGVLWYWSTGPAIVDTEREIKPVAPSTAR